MIQKLKIIVTFILVLAFTTNAYTTFEFLYPAVREMYWYIFLFVMSMFFIVIEKEKALSNIPKRVLIWLALYILSLMLAYTISSQSEVVKLAAIVQIKALAAFVGFFVLITDKTIQKSALYALVATVLIGSSINLLEYFTDMITWTSVEQGVTTISRASGLYMNANYSGFMLTFSLIFASLVVNKKWLWPFIIITTMGVLVTFSRTSWAFLLIIIVSISLIRAGGEKQSLNPLNMKPSSLLALFFAMLISAGLVVSIISGAALELVKTSEYSHFLSADTMSRLEGNVDDNSAHERYRLIFRALEVGVENPIFGAGFAYTYEWPERVAPHNEWLMMFAERGVIGLLIYGLFYVFIWLKSGKYGKLFVVIFGLSALSSHNGLELPATYLFVALAYLIKDEDYLHLT